MIILDYFINTEISPIYQYIRQFDDPSVPLGALLALSFEHLLAWIAEIQQAYVKDTDPDYIKKGAE